MEGGVGWGKVIGKSLSFFLYLMGNYWGCLVSLVWYQFIYFFLVYILEIYIVMFDILKVVFC